MAFLPVFAQNAPSPDVFAVGASLGFSAISLLFFVGLALVLSSYVKIVTVLGIVRVGLGVASLPSALVTGGLAVVLSFFVMFPTIQAAAGAMDAKIRASGGVSSDMTRARVLEAGFGAWFQFIEKHAGESERERFSKLAGEMEGGGSANSWQVVAPAFVVSELKEAFATGLSIFLPFLVIDLLIANLLVAVGLIQMNPLLVAFPFKLLLFVMVDGWALVTGNLVATYL